MDKFVIYCALIWDKNIGGIAIKSNDLDFKDAVNNFLKKRGYKPLDHNEFWGQIDRLDSEEQYLKWSSQNRVDLT